MIDGVGRLTLMCLVSGSHFAICLIDSAATQITDVSYADLKVRTLKLECCHSHLLNIFLHLALR